MELRYGFIGLVLGTSLLGGCLSSSNSSSDSPATPPITPPPTQASTLKIGILPDTQGGGANTSIHPMRALLDLYRAQDVDVVLVIGDLSETATPAEYAQWRSVAEDFKSDFTMLPIQGNHDIKGTDVDWIENVSDLVPADAMHMPGQEYKTYAVIRDNVLIINVSYGHMPFAYDFIRQTIATHRDKVDHIIVATHNSMVGTRYGYIREKAVEAYDTSASDQAFLQVHEDYRQLFADNDVIYVAGHEHSYTRSLVSGNFGGQYTEIVSGHASYKGYDSRYGESEQIQNVVMAKVNDPGATGKMDVTASIFSFNGDLVDYTSLFETHTITSNEDGVKELASPSWKLFDRFTRTAERCDKIVFPSSIPDGNQLNMTHDKRYRTNTCVSAGGFEAKIIDGENTIFNRYETRTRTTGVETGVNTATSNTALAARYYRWLHIPHASYSPNLNNSQRVRLINAGTADEEVEIRETTIDLKKHVSLSWVSPVAGALSDSLIVSGIQGQDGTYLNARGIAKNIQTDTGLPGSLGDGSETGKQPVALPAGRVNSNWILDDDSRGDDYVLQMNLKADMDPEKVTLGRWDAQASQWTPVANAECTSKLSYDASYLTTLPNDVAATCSTAAGVVTVGVQHVWARLDQDGTYALINR